VEVLKKIKGAVDAGKRGGILVGVVFCLWTAVGPVGLFCSRAAAAEELTAPETKVKAAFLYNFAKLAEWPTNTFTNAATPLTIGVLGSDPFGPVLEEVTKGKTINGRAIVIARYDNVADVGGCQLLFISVSENGHLPAILAKLASQPILTVGDTPQFAVRGGVIGLIKREGEIHFEINRAAAARAQLKLSSKLLRLAELAPPAAGGQVP
jgi:hypothetical protein